MSCIVMKFGGSSLVEEKFIEKVAIKVISAKRKYDRVVAVVSARGDATDDLIDKARKITGLPDERELDILLSTGEQQSAAYLAMAIKARGHEAISLVAGQIGIYTNGTYGKARITRINPKRIEKELKKGQIVIIAGFQGIDSSGNITTLGRGGSDLTAIALAHALNADICEIYSDVGGVYTADPYVVTNARKIDRLSYDELLELAGSGADVMQARAVELAKRFNVIFRIRHSRGNGNGTLVQKEAKRMEKPEVTSVVYDKNQVKLSITDVPDRPGIAAKIFGALAKENINVDMIIQSAARGKNNDISFTVTRSDFKKCMPILEKVKNELNAGDIIHDDKVAKVSIIGVGMKTHPGVAAKMFRVLAKEKINIEMISTSEIKISCVIRENEVEKAVKTLHFAFDLGRK